MTTQDFYAWIAGAPPEQLPILADAAEDGVSDPENLAPFLAEGLRACQVEGLAPAELYRGNPIAANGMSLFTAGELAGTAADLADLLASGYVEHLWGWRVDAPPPTGPDAHARHRVGFVRGPFLVGVNGGPSSNCWRAFDDKVVALACLGKVSDALEWQTGALHVTRSFFAGAFGQQWVYHVVREPLGPEAALAGVGRPAVCGLELSWMSHWTGRHHRGYTCERCGARLRVMIKRHGRRWALERQARV